MSGSTSILDSLTPVGAAPVAAPAPDAAPAPKATQSDSSSPTSILDSLPTVAVAARAPTQQQSSQAAQDQAWKQAGISNPLPPSTDPMTQKVRDLLAPTPGTTYGNIVPLARDSSGHLHMAMPNIARNALLGLTESPSEATTVDTYGNINVAPEVAGNVALAAGGGKLVPKAPEALATDLAVDTAKPLPSSIDLFSPEMKARAETTPPQGPVSQVPEPPPAVEQPQPSVAAPANSGMPPTPKTAAEAKQMASDYYAAANQAGGTLSPAFTNRWIDAASKIGPQTEAGKIVSGTNPMSALTERLQQLRDQPLTLKEVQDIDEGLGNLIDSEHDVTGLSKVGKNLLNVQSTLRNMIAGAGPADVTGGTAGFDALNQGRAAWSQAMKMSDLERIQTRAAMMDQPATGFKTGIRTLLNNPSRVRGYSPDEIAALKDAQNRGVIGQALHVLGSRLLPLVGAALGHEGGGGGLIGSAIGGAAGHVASSVARNAAEALQAARMQNAMDTVARNMPPPAGWRPGPLQIQPGMDVMSAVPWRMVPQLAAPTRAPPTSQNPATGLPEYSLEANQRAAQGDMAHKLAGQLADGSLADHGALSGFVNQNKRELRAQFGGQGIQNIMKVGALVRRATQEQTPSTVLSAILKGTNPDILSQVGNDPQSLIAKAIASPQLTQALAMKSKGTLNKIGQNRIITLLGAGDAPGSVDSNSADTKIPVSPVLRGAANLGSAGADTGYGGSPQNGPPPANKVAAPNRVGA